MSRTVPMGSSKGSPAVARSVAQREAILPLILRRDRLPTLVGLVGVTVLAWLYLIWLAAGMGAGMGSKTPAGDMAAWRA